MTALLRGNSDIFNGFLGAYDQDFLNQLLGDTDAYIVKLQHDGLIRQDIPSNNHLFADCFEIGIINSSRSHQSGTYA